VQRHPAEYGANPLCDWQIDPEPAAEIAEDRRGRQPFDHLADLGFRLLR
jgi:hypothetical protein